MNSPRSPSSLLGAALNRSPTAPIAISPKAGGAPSSSSPRPGEKSPCSWHGATDFDGAGAPRAPVIGSMPIPGLLRSSMPALTLPASVGRGPAPVSVSISLSERSGSLTCGSLMDRLKLQDASSPEASSGSARALGVLESIEFKAHVDALRAPALAEPPLISQTEMDDGYGGADDDDIFGGFEGLDVSPPPPP